MLTIQLKELLFFSYHGVHEEETILGNMFEVNVELSVDAPGSIHALEQTINYVSVYKVIKQQMDTPARLLETLVQQMADRIHELDDRIRSVTVSVNKKNPPIPNMEGRVGVCYKKDY